MAERPVERPVERAGAPALEIRGLNVFYGASHALQGVDLTLRRGALSVVGRNGMGKTTLCKTIMGLVPGLNTTFGLIPIHGANVLLHAFIAIAATYYGFVHRLDVTAPAGTTTPV